MRKRGTPLIKALLFERRIPYRYKESKYIIELKDKVARVGGAVVLGGVLYPVFRILSLIYRVNLFLKKSNKSNTYFEEYKENSDYEKQ